MNKYIVSSVVFSLLMGVSPVYAESSGVAVPKFVDITKDARAKCETQCETNTDKRACVASCMADARVEMKADFKAQRETRQEEMKEKLKEFKNQQKADIAARISENMNKLNERLTNHFLAVLEKLEGIMVRVAAGDVDGDGAADIDAANDAIDDAQDAAEDQADNDYTVTVTTEDKIRVDVGTARQTLHTDLRAVWEKVKTAREAVRKAATHMDNRQEGSDDDSASSSDDDDDSDND